MKAIKYALILIGLGLLPACDWFASKPAVPVKLRLINVLEPKFFKDAHIKGTGAVESINVADSDLEAEAKKWDKTLPIVTYCSNYFCLGSGEAARKLTSLGFTDVWAYEGGMAEWFQLGQDDAAYQTEGPAQEAYLKVVVKKPAHNDETIRVITAQELQKKMKEANMLDGEVLS